MPRRKLIIQARKLKAACDEMNCDECMFAWRDNDYRLCRLTGAPTHWNLEAKFSFIELGLFGYAQTIRRYCRAHSAAECICCKFYSQDTGCVFAHGPQQGPYALDELKG